MPTRLVQLIAGVLIIAVGTYLVAEPEVVRDAFDRTPKTSSDWINLRASNGGTLIGIGAFIAWLPALRPWSRTLVGLLGWSMAGIGAARLVGFAIDGGPDTRQYIWITAEIILVIGALLTLRWLKRR